MILHTVKDLIEYLQTLDPELKIYAQESIFSEGATLEDVEILNEKPQQYPGNLELGIAKDKYFSNDLTGGELYLSIGSG